MLKKILLVLTISILMLLISGCTDEVVEETPATENITESDVIADNVPDDSTSQGLLPVNTTPDNYEFLGSREITSETVEDDYVSVPGIVGGYEGLYMYLDSTDVYIDVIELDSSASAMEFITQYKAEFKQLSSGSRFMEDPINGHSAVRILEYVTADSDYIPRYTYIWSNDKFVFVVGGATGDYDVLRTLAEATGY